jgi:hypothetical protein
VDSDRETDDLRAAQEALRSADRRGPCLTMWQAVEGDIEKVGHDRRRGRVAAGAETGNPMDCPVDSGHLEAVFRRLGASEIFGFGKPFGNRPRGKVLPDRRDEAANAATR